MLIDIEPLRPYCLAHTAARLADYPEAVDRFDGKYYTRLLFVERHPLLVQAAQIGPPTRARLKVRLIGKTASTEAARTAVEDLLARVLGIRQDVRPFYRAFRGDPLLGPAIRSFPGLRVVGRSTLWETLVQMVVSQQIHLRFAHSILSDIARTLGRRARFDGDLLVTFPSPTRMARLTEKDLRGFRLSAAKAFTIRRLAHAFVDRTLSEKALTGMTDEEVIEVLTSIPGIGRWTAEFTLLRGLLRLDAFPGGDLGVIKYLAQGLLGYKQRAREASMRNLAEAWRPFRGLALIYCYAELRRRARSETRGSGARS